MVEEKEGPGFKIRDRRVFARDGEPQETPPQRDETSHTRERVSQEARMEEDRQRERLREISLPKPTFSGFLTSFFLPQVLTFLGEIPHPETQKKEKNLPMAKYLIDVLGIIQEKTKGNLTPEEKNHVDNLLAELRLLYVKAVNL